MRRLKQTLLAGGVVYPAGTAEDEIEVAVQREDVWDDDGIEVPASVLEVDADAHPNTAALRELVDYLVELHRFNMDLTVADLLGHANEVFAPEGTDEEPAGETETEGDGGSEDEEPEGDGETGAVPPAYAEQSLADLRGVAETRGLEFKGSGAGGNIVKADHDALVAALEADDAAKA